MIYFTISLSNITKIVNVKCHVFSGQFIGLKSVLEHKRLFDPCADLFVQVEWEVVVAASVLAARAGAFLAAGPCAVSPVTARQDRCGVTYGLLLPL